MECFFFWFDGCSIDQDANASWVQAIGSVFAILVAIWIPKRDRKEAARAADEKILESFSLVVDELRFCNQKLLDMFYQARNDQLRANSHKLIATYYRSTMPLVQALLNTPIIQLPNPQLITFAVEASQIITNLEAMGVEFWPDNRPKHPDKIPEEFAKFEKVLVACEGLIQEIRKDMKEKKVGPGD